MCDNHSGAEGLEPNTQVWIPTDPEECDKSELMSFEVFLDLDNARREFPEITSWSRVRACDIEGPVVMDDPDDDTFTCHNCFEVLDMDVLAEQLGDNPDMFCLDCYDDIVGNMTDDELAEMEEDE